MSVLLHLFCVVLFCCFVVVVVFSSHVLFKQYTVLSIRIPLNHLCRMLGEHKKQVTNKLLKVELKKLAYFFFLTS